MKRWATPARVAGLSGWATPSTLWMKSRKFQSERDQTKYMQIEVANCRKLFQILYVYRAVTVMIEAALKVTKLILPASRMTNAGSLRRIKAGKITFSETRFCHIVGNPPSVFDSKISSGPSIRAVKLTER